MKYILIIIIFIFISFKSFCQNYIDQIILISGDTITCRITLVNDQNIFYLYEKEGKQKDNHILLQSVYEYSWLSENTNFQPTPMKEQHPFDAINKWNFGIKLKQQFNYPISHSSPAFSIYRKNHNLYIGPEYSYTLKEYFINGIENHNQKFWGLNFGYRYIFDSHLRKTNLFVHMDFSIYQLKYTEHQLGYNRTTNHKTTIVENNIGLGVNYQLLEHVALFGGIGFGSTNGFFLMIDQFIPHSFIGIEYTLKSRK